MKTAEYAAVAAARSVDPDRWQTEFSTVLDRIAPRFARYEPLRHAGALMGGMLSGLDRKNCWTIAEHRGASTPLRGTRLVVQSLCGFRLMGPGPL